MYRSRRQIWSLCLFVVIHLSGLFAIKVPGMADLLHNFEAIDPEVVDVFTFNNRPALRNRGDTNEIDIMDVDTSDILNCFSTLSYICFQKKIIFYLDSLNRVDKINLFGGYMSFIRISQGVMPPITEQMLASRGINNEPSLTTLLRDIFDDFIDSHILRITVPVINARLDARNAKSHCYDFDLTKVKSKNYTRDISKEATCYRSNQNMAVLSSAFIMKMLMLLPTLLKIIAAKAIFGLIMGTVSVILSKMAILPLLLSYTKKNTAATGNAALAANSYKQGSSLPINYPDSTDGYGFYYEQNGQPIRGSMAEGANGVLDNNIGSGDFIGPTVLPTPYNEGSWAEPKISNKNYNVQTNEIKYAPRKDRYRSMAIRAIPEKMKYNAGYVETSIDNSRQGLLLTTIGPIDDTNDRMSEFENNGNVRAK